MYLLCLLCLALRRYAFDYMILEFAQEPGYLSLTPSSRAKLNITISKAYIGKYNYSKDIQQLFKQDFMV